MSSKRRACCSSRVPGYRIDGELFDNYAPSSSNVRNIWANIATKVNREEAPNIILNLIDTRLSAGDFAELLSTDPIPGLNRLWVIDKNGLTYLVGAL